MEIIAATFAFLAIAAVVVSLFRGAAPVSRATERRLEGWGRPPPQAGPGAGDILRRGSSALPPLRDLLSDSAWSERAATDLQQAGLRLKVSEYLLLRMMCAAGTTLLVLLITRASILGIVLAVPAAGLGFVLPAFYVRVRKDRRSEAISRQLVETLQLISSALRSGFAFTQAVELTAKQMTPPMQDELNQFLRDNAIGSTMDDALRAMVKRAGSYDLDMAVTAILVQRTTGGNLSETLDNVTETMRERERIRGEIRSLTAHQRLTGLILSIYPAALALLFFAISPTIMSVLWTEMFGRVLLIIGGSLQIIGIFVIRRILAIDI